jgi:hypothetical protein
LLETVGDDEPIAVARVIVHGVSGAAMLTSPITNPVPLTSALPLPHWGMAGKYKKITSTRLTVGCITRSTRKDFGKVRCRRRRGLTAYGCGSPQNHGACRLALARANCLPSYTTGSDTAEGGAIRWQADRSGGAGLDPQRGRNSDSAWPSALVAHHWEGWAAS